MEKTAPGRLSKYIVTDGSFYKRAMLLIIPVLFQNLINQGVNMMDTIMVGNLGEVSISASSLANQYYAIYNIMCMGISAAGLVLASQYWGAGEPKTVRRTFDLVMQIVMIMGLVFAVLTALFPETIMSLYTPDRDVILEGAKYLRVTAFIFLPHGISLVMSNVIRAVGNARLGLVISCVSFVVNIGCNYVFIFGVPALGIPALGVMGAAVGTLCARIVELLVCVIYMFRFENRLIYRPNGLIKPPTKNLFSEFIRLGLPAIISDTLLGVAATVISMILGRMGKEATSAYAIVVVLERLCTVATGGIASASGVMIGQTVGQGDYERAHKEGRSFLIISVGIGIVASILVRFAGVWSIGMYKITDETKAIAVSMMGSSAVIVFFQAVQSALKRHSPRRRRYEISHDSGRNLPVGGFHPARLRDGSRL